MLIHCPECELQVSDKAVFCPHCGYPLRPEAKKYTKKSRRKRLPNGFGQISEIKGRNLRKPFRAMVNVGTAPNGRPITKLLKPVSYFETYNEAYAALVEYNKNPYCIDENITMNELYERWIEQKQHLIVPRTKVQIDLFWGQAKELHDLHVREVRVHHIKEWLDTALLSVTTKLRIKNILNQLFDFAVEYELTDRNYSKLISVERMSHDAAVSRKSHISFTDEEMNILWGCKDEPFVDIILMQCYTGLRPQEVGKVEVANVHLDENYMIGGMKTDAGRNRPIPIHPSVRYIIEKYYDEATRRGLKYVFFHGRFSKNPSGENLTYIKYNTYFQRTIQKLGLSPTHKPHDCRKQFVTMAKKYNVNEYAIKRIIGHSIDDLTERVYTDRPISWLYEEISKIQV